MIGNFLFALLLSQVHVNVCMLSRFTCFSGVQFCATLWTIACEAPLSMRFSRQEYWSGLPCPPPGDLPNPGIKPVSLRSLASAGMFFTTSTTQEALQVNRRNIVSSVQFSCSVRSDSATLWTAAQQASLSITNSWSLLKLMSIESVMPSNHLNLCRPLLLPPSIFPASGSFLFLQIILKNWF